jgi:hypothetical protein
MYAKNSHSSTYTWPHSVVREINRINERELELGLNGASWHDDYKGKGRFQFASKRRKAGD